MPRSVIAGLVALALAALLVWQWSRERQITACHSAGGIWNGAQSRCEPRPASPILKRNIERSFLLPTDRVTIASNAVAFGH